MVDAVRRKQSRAFEPRLSGDWPYAPFLRPSHESNSGESRIAINASAAAIVASADTPGQIRAIAYLMIGDIDSSIRELQLASSASRDANVWSDLAAALIVRATQMDDGDSAIDALAAADRAIELDANHPMARFNRALSLERLGLFGEARRDWQRAAQLDPSSQWSAEALKRMHEVPLRNEGMEKRQAFQRLDRQRPALEEIRTLVRELPQPLRAYGESLCMCAWAAAVERGDVEGATERLDVARVIGDELRAYSGESLLQEAVATADRATAKGSVTTLAKAHLTYCRGRQEHNAHDSLVAERDFREAERLFAISGSPMALVARYYIGSALHAQLRLGDSLDMLATLSRQIPQSAGYRALSAQIGWERGLCLAALGDPSAGIEILTKSRNQFAAIHESSNRASLEANLADVYDHIGNTSAAWSARRAALTELERSGDMQRCIVALEGAAGRRVRGREWRRAGALINIATAMATRIADAYYSAHILALRSIVDTELGEPDRSAAHLHQARTWMEKIGDGPSRLQVSADTAMADGYAVRSSNADAATARFTAALTYYRDAGYRVPIPRVLLERSRTLRSLERFDEAASDLDAAIAVMEELRRTMPDLIQRAEAFEPAGEIFDNAVSLALQRGQPERAFEFSEMGRARVLVDTYRGDNQPPLSLRAIQASLAVDAAIVEYCIGTDVVAFLITPTRFEVVPIQGTRESLRHAVERSDRVLLETTLVAPIRQFLSGVSTIAIVPDRFLSAVPFASLQNEGRRLIDDFVLVQSPSASVAIMASRAASRRMYRSVVTIAATEFDRARYPALPTIDAAKREATQIASVYPGSDVILGQHATPRRLIEALSRFDLVHFAGHALADSRAPAGSRLLLSGGELNAAGISHLHLRNSPIVVLAACRTAQSSESRDGVASIAVAFLIAGAPVVVASGLDLDDYATAGFNVRLFRNMLRNGDAAEALRETIRGESKMDARLASISAIGGTSRLVRPIERSE